MFKTYACSDLHGNYDLFEQINNFIDNTDVIYFLGDAIDRGPRSYELSNAILNDRRWIYMMGNHEEMMVDAFKRHECMQIWLDEANGGRETLKEMLNNTTSDERKVYLGRIARLPLEITVSNRYSQIIHLCHSGCYYGQKSDILWDRYHYLRDQEMLGNEYIIHGHTPCAYMLEQMMFFTDDEDFDPNKIVKYNRGHKINIDCGTAWTNRAALIDLDTFEEKYFEIKD